MAYKVNRILKWANKWICSTSVSSHSSIVCATGAICERRRRHGKNPRAGDWYEQSTSTSVRSRVLVCVCVCVKCTSNRCNEMTQVRFTREEKRMVKTAGGSMFGPSSHTQRPSSERYLLRKENAVLAERAALKCGQWWDNHVHRNPDTNTHVAHAMEHHVNPRIKDR